MKKSRVSKRNIIFAILVLAAILCGTWVLLPDAGQPDPDRVVQESWKRMQQVGRYGFSTTLEQTTYPAPRLTNVGRSAQREVYHITGVANLPEDSLLINLYQNEGSLMNRRDGIEIRIQDGKASGRLTGLDWTELDSFSASGFAPGNDAASFLSAADNVRFLDAANLSIPLEDRTLRVSAVHYSFDLNPDRFAEIMRQQMIQELQRAGKLPAGMTLSASDRYREMAASGEVWIDADGLPARMKVKMEFPQEKNGEKVVGLISTDFYDQQRDQLLVRRGLPWQVAGVIGLPLSTRQIRQQALAWEMAAVVLLLVILMLVYSHKPAVYACIAILIIFTMLASPVWQGVQAAAFAKEIAAQRTKAQASQQAQQDEQERLNEIYGGEWNPHLSPLKLAEFKKALNEIASPNKDDGPLAWRGLSTLDPMAPQQSNDGEEVEEDTDQDGLSDSFEKDFWPDSCPTGPDPSDIPDDCVLNPQDADTDNDGLSDNEEVNLNTHPNKTDTDGDGILDPYEVQGFRFEGDPDADSYFETNNYWYSNPELRDTDGDGQPDGAECPQRVKEYDDPPDWQPSVCQDTDGDLLPDIFDRDDDDDGVPTSVDASPYDYYSEVYSRSNPFKMTVSPVVTDTDKTVFMTYQLLPTNPEHLTYAMNVLDWPTGDVDGQIMRVNDTTFSEDLTEEQLAQDPKAEYGDMRLIPMLEVRLTGDSLPLPMTSTLTAPISSTLFSDGEFRLTGSAGYTQVELTQGPAGTYPVYLGEGSCDNIYNFSKLGDFDVGVGGEDASISLSQFADGGHVLYVMNPAEDKINACADIEPVAHGVSQNTIVDSSFLEAYGGSARNDFDGSVLVYTPLQLVSDLDGGAPVAFQSRVPFTTVGDGFSDSVQEVSAVWLLNMLTDICKPQPEDWDSTSDGDWCTADHLDRWNLDTPRIVQTYGEEFNLIGVSVQVDWGVEMAVLFEDPALDPYPEYDDPLWGLARAMEGSFAAGRDSDKDEQRDVTVDTLVSRFDPDFNNCSAYTGDPADAPYIYREDYYDDWGLPCNAFQTWRGGYDFADGVYDFISHQVKDEIFEPYFNVIAESERPQYANLLFAREASARSLGFGDSVCTDGVCDFDFSGQPVNTQAVMNWAPYQRDGDEWSSYPLEEYLDLMEANLRKLDSYKPSDDTDEAKKIVDGQIAVARLNYEAMYNGLAMLVAVNGEAVYNKWQIFEDSYIYNDFYRLNAKAQIVTKVVSGLVQMLVDTYYVCPLLYKALFKNATTIGAKIDRFFVLFKDGVSDKVSSLNKLISNRFAKVAIGIGIGLLVIALAVMATFYLINPNTTAGKVGGRILFSAIGLLTGVLAVKALVDGIKAFQALPKTLDTISKLASAASKGAQAAAIVGVIIGALITWGVFFASWGMSGKGFGSLEVNSMIAQAIAATITLLIFAALSATLVGAIIVAIIGIIDALIAIICAAAGANELEEDHWARQYVCIGISGWVTKIIQWTIYSQTYMIDYANSDRLDFTGLAQDLEDLALGMAVTNNISYTIDVSNVITLSDIPLDWKAAVFAWQYTDDIAKSSHFVYQINPGNGDEYNLDEGLERFDTVGWWDPDAGDETHHGWLDYNVDNHQFYQDFKAQTEGFSIAMPQPGINRAPVAYLSEGAAIPTQECIAIPVLIGVVWILIPECHIRTFRNTNHMDVSGSLTVDVFPATLDEFYSLAEIENRGYSFSWGRDAQQATPDSADTTMRFPIFPDADGDGLKSPAFSGNDPNDADYDSDNDRLSDYYEATKGSDPMLFDTDDDGLWDSDEIRLGTDPTRKDSDGDGLPDEQELQGWLFTYGFESDGTPIETMVYPDPLNPDSDFDGLTDLMEQIYGFNPNVPSAASILDYKLDLREWDSPQVLLRLDEGADTALFSDSSNFAYEGICEPPACPTSGLNGRYAKAVSMGGSEYISLPTSAGTISFDGGQPFTLAAWISQPNGGTLISKWNEDTDYKQEVIFDITAGGKLRLQKDGGSLSSAASIPSAQDTWTHVAVAFDGSTATFFINGEEDSSSSWSIAASTAISDSLVVVGGYMGASGPTGGYDGLIDEVAIYNRALSEDEVYHFLYQARYNFNDSFVRPGEKLTYKSVVENLLNSRFAYGLLSTLFDPREAILDWASKLLPRTFVLWPDNPVVTGVNTFEMSETIQIDPAYDQSGNLTITQTAKAQIVDRRTESNMAELWLKFNEASGATEFEDSSGNMPPRNVSCTTCPTSGQTGIINNAIKFSASGDTPLQLPDLDRMKLTDYGYTFALWVKPASGLPSGSSVTLLKSDNNDRFVLNIRNSSGQYVPTIEVNNASVPVSSSLWRTIIPGVWSHLAIRYRSADSAMDIFVNGARVDTITGISPINANANLWLGGTPQSVDYWVDDLRIFSRPLGTLDINRLAERPVLKLTMDPTDLHNADESVYAQSITVGSEINSNISNPIRWANSVHGASLFTDSAYPFSIGFLKINGNALLNMQDGAFTFSVWVNPDNYDTDVWQGIFGYNSGENDAYPSLERRGQQLRFRFGSGSAPKVHEAGNVLTPNRWNHVVVTFQPSNVSGQYEYVLYVNAQRVASYLFDSKPTSNQTFFVGHSSHTYQIIAKNFYVSDTDGDPGSHVEVWIDRHLNGGGATRVFKDSDGDPVSIPKETWEWCSNPTAGCSYIDNNTYSNFQSVQYKVWEDDAPGNPSDECGSVSYSWTSKTTSRETSLSNGFHGTLYTSLSRESSYYTGLIDELEVYRYALDSEQVFDLYNAIPTAARLPLDERPASDTFENRAYVGVQDDGVCTEPDCPAAGTVGLINQAVRFDGADDVIYVPGDPSINPPVDTTSDFMFSLWFNTECPNCGLYSLWSGSSAINQAYLKSGNVCVKTGATEMCSYGGGLADAQWHHLVYTNNAANNTANLWLEGVIVNTVLNGNTMSANSNGQARLGYAPDATSQYMNGQLDDVRIFRYSQAADVIALLRRRAPIALFHLDEQYSASGFQDATAADWLLTCSSGECPQTDVEGRLSRAVEFDGVDDRLKMSQTTLSDTTQSFSIGLWVMPTRDPVDYAQTLWVMPTSGNGAPKYSIVTAPDSLRLCVLTRSRQSVTDCDEETELSKVGLIQNAWNHVVLTVQRTSASIETYKLYINGYEDSSGAGNSGSDVSDGLGRIFVGNKPSSYVSLAGGTFGGRIDEVSVYEYELNEIDVRDAFYYQMAQVEERKVLNLVIDAEEPQVDLVSYNSGFPYVSGTGQQLQVDAWDPTSGIGMVEMQIEHPNLPTNWQTAPLCEDSSSGTAFCPYFDPGDFDGKYTLNFRAIDLVGYQSDTPAYDFYVDKGGPHITSNQSGGTLLAAEAHPSLKHTWLLALDGNLDDPILGDSSPGSGLNLDSVHVTVYSEAGEEVGDGVQVPEIVPTGGGFYDWSLDYVIPEKEPTGKLKVVVEAQDMVGNQGRLEFNILLDATPSRGKVHQQDLPEPDLGKMLSASSVDSTVLISGTLSGDVSDVPNDDIPYITQDGKAATSGVSKVETAFTPEEDFSFLFNEPYPDGLLAWLPLDSSRPPVDGEGNPDPDSDKRLFVDISPYQISGECENPNCPQEGLSGHKIGSIYYYGTGQYINLGQQVDLAGGSFTASIWAKRDGIDHNDPILWQGPVSVPELRFLFGLNSENYFVCGFGGSDLVTPEAYPDTDWHYWACTYDLDSGQRAIYRDGQQVASDSAAPIPSMYENLFIGKAPVGSFKGYLDELVIFDRALDAAEIRDRYTDYNTVFHLAVEESFYADGDLLDDRSGYFQLAELQSGQDDPLNKVVAGKVGNYALALDGNDKLAVLPAYSLSPDRAAFTQSAWINPAGVGERDVFSERDENPEMRYPTLILTTDNRLKVGFGDFYNWHEAETGPNVLPQDEWSFVATTFDGQIYRVYVNGEQVLASTDLAGLHPYASERFNIGDNFTGQIDDVRVYMRALSEFEIRALMGIDWREADLQGSGSEATWTADVVQGLEGPYHLGVRGWDEQGHYDTGALADDQWGGVVDTLAPRISMLREPDPVPTDTFTVTYTFSVEDTMLDEASILENMCSGEVELEREYYNSSWYLAKGVPPNSTLYRISGQCQGDRRTFAEVGLYACDAGGNCSSATFPPFYTNFVYLPLVVSTGEASLPDAPQPERSAPPPEEAKPPEGAQKLIERPLAIEADSQAPRLEILTGQIGQADVRSLMTINLRGKVWEDNQLAWVKVRVLRQGQEVYTTRAAVCGEMWNAMWVFLPGDSPQDGVYTLEATASDLAGNQTTLSQEFNVQLTPEQPETGGN